MNPVGLRRAGYGEFDHWTIGKLRRLSPERRSKVEQFLMELEIKGVGPHTIQSYVKAILTLGYEGKPYETLERADLFGWMSWLNSNGYSPQSIETYRRRAKSFLRWVHGCQSARDLSPPPVNCIVVPKRKHDLPREVLSKPEIRAMLQICESQRNRALIHVGYESGCRAGELLGMHIRDVELDRYGAVLIVRGKTGARRIRLVESVPDLQLWLNMHPRRSNPDAFLWPNRPEASRALTVNRVNAILHSLALRAGIRKRVHPHLLRHSRATHLAKVLTEAQLRIYFGWTKQSDVPARYVHLSGRDVDEAILKHYGIAQTDEVLERELKPQSCSRCQAQNPFDALYCMRCSMPLDARAALQLEGQRTEADELVAEVLEEIQRQAPKLVEEAIRKARVGERMDVLISKREAPPAG